MEHNDSQLMEPTRGRSVTLSQSDLSLTSFLRQRDVILSAVTILMTWYTHYKSMAQGEQLRSRHIVHTDCVLLVSFRPSSRLTSLLISFSFSKAQALSRERQGQLSNGFLQPFTSYCTSGSISSSSSVSGTVHFVAKVDLSSSAAGRQATRASSLQDRRLRGSDRHPLPQRFRL